MKEEKDRCKWSEVVEEVEVELVFELKGVESMDKARQLLHEAGGDVMQAMHLAETSQMPA